MLFFFTVPPKILPFSFGEETFNAGHPVTVACAIIDGDKPMSVFWTFHGSNISQENDIVTLPLGDSGSILTIRSVRAEHAGNYTCIAMNSAGLATQSSFLRVTGKEN